MSRTRSAGSVGKNGSVPTWTFRIGDVFDAEDSLSVWICTLAIAFNDAIHANLKVEAAETPWERGYEWRVAISHFNEACLHLERGREDDHVVAFLESEAGLGARFDEALSRYDAVRPVANRIRNQAAFHYPDKSGRRAVARALRDLADDEGAMRGTTLRDSRQLYADDVLGRLLINASGGTLDTYAKAATDFGDAVASFARFAHAAVEAYFIRHRDALRREEDKPEEGDDASENGTETPAATS